MFSFVLRTIVFDKVSHVFSAEMLPQRPEYWLLTNIPALRGIQVTFEECYPTPLGLKSRILAECEKRSEMIRILDTLGIQRLCVLGLKL